jgi:hypothetical protein
VIELSWLALRSQSSDITEASGPFAPLYGQHSFGER